MQKAILVMGYPASGKSTITAEFKDQGFKVFNRDSVGGKVASLVPGFKAALEAGESVVADNLFLTVESRAPFIEAAKAAGVPLECHWMQTSIEDCQVNACNRMYDRYNTVFMTPEDIKAHPEANKDPNIFPIAAMFAAKKRLEGDKKKGIPSGKPTKDEGFSRIVKVPFVRRPATGFVKAIILDYDGTLRDDARNHGGEHPYPTHRDQVSLLPNVPEVLRAKMDEGYVLLGVTIQSGIEKGHMTEADAVSCIMQTNRLIGDALGIPLHISAHYCPHHRFPVGCYCRKPQVGLGVQLIRQYELDPAACIMVGDMKIDQTFAERCGFQFQWAHDFFRGD